MRTPSSLAFVLLLAGVLSLGSFATADSARMAVLGAPVLTTREPAGLDDPFPIARFRVNEAQLAEALKAFDPGPVVRMPRAEFEARVQKAARIAAEDRDPPRLLEANYTATLSGSDLIGEAEWIIVNRRGSPAFLSLEPNKLALQSAAWADGSVAILGAFHEGFAAGLGVWVPPGRQTLKVKWSAAGSGFGADRQFDLRVPSCSSTTLALEVPDGLTPANPADVLLTGPFPGRDPKWKLWRYRFGERSRLDVGIRGPNEAGGAVVLTSLTAKYDLANAQLGCNFEYDLRTARGSVGEWTFAVPPGLTVTDVVANDRSSWRFDPATRVLHVGLRQTAYGGKVAIAAFGPASTAELPIIRPLNAIGSTERIELRVPPEVRLERLDTADYRLADSTVNAEGTRTLSLVGSLVPAGSGSVRRAPSIRVAATDAEFTTNETLNWRIDANRVVFGARVEVKVRRGPLFRLAFRTPPGFTVDRIVSVPEEAVSFAGVVGTGVEVEFAKQMASGQRVELQFEFRGPVLPLGGATLPYPAFAPLGALECDGRLTIEPTAAWRIATQAGSGAIAFRGSEPSGTLTVSPVAPTFSATLETRVEVRGMDSLATTKVKLVPKSGQLATVRFFEQGPSSANRSWKLLDSSNAISTATPFKLDTVPSFPAVSPFAPVSMIAANRVTAGGTIWTLKLARPTAEPVILETTAPRPATSRQPLIVLDATDVSDRFDDSAPPAPSRSDLGWSFENLHLITIASDSRPHAIFGGTIRTRGGPTMPIALPDRAEVIAVSVGGYWLEPGGSQLNSSGELTLPIPDGTGPFRFEVRYRLPEVGIVPYRITSPEPVLPGVEHNIARWWAVPGHLSAAWPLGLRGSSPTSDLPLLLGEPLDLELAVYRVSEASLIFVPARFADGAGLALATLIGIVGWFGTRRANRTAGVLLLVLLGLSGLAYWLGPPAWQRVALPPLVAGIAGVAAIVLSRGWRSPRGIAVAVLLLPTFTANAQAPAAADVAFILSEPGGEVAVVPRALLDRLERTAKRADPTFVIGSASYSGRLEDGLARFTARFAVHSFCDGEANFELPLADVRLERASVDGQPAQPLASKADAYSIPIAGRGPHVVEVRFAATLASNGPERELKFGIPEAPDSHFTFAAPLTARQLQTVGRNGDQSLATEKDAIRFTAALGNIRSIHLRWREGTGGSAANVTVREGCIWDVSENAPKLTACYQLHVKSGSVSSLRFDLPVGLEPTRVAVRSLDSILVPTAVRDWNLGKEANGWRPLNVELLAPADGRMLLTLECEPRAAPTRLPILAFPRIVGVTRESALYGLRSSGVVVESIGRAGVIDYAADALIREFGSVPDLRLNPASVVVGFSPRAGETAELRPVLRVSGELPVANQDAVWNVEANRAEGRGTFAWTGPDAASLVEFAFPATLLEVRGPDVASWSQADGRVQVWLKKSVKDGSLDWLASTPRTGTVFEPPMPAPISARLGSQTVRIRPPAGWGVRIDRDKGWKSVATPDREWGYQSEGSLPPPRVELFPPVATAARGFGLVEFTGNAATFRASAEIPISANRPHHLVLQADGIAAGVAALLDVPPGTIVREKSEPTGSREWSLDVPASAAVLFRATLTVPISAKGTAPLPIVDLRVGGSVPNADGVLRAFGTSGLPAGIRLDGASLASGGEFAALQAAWPGEAERLRRSGGSFWSVKSGRVRFAFPALAAPTPPKAAAPETAAEEPSPVAATSPLPWIAALAWCGTVIGVLTMFVRAPRSTWPEQLGLLGALFGYSVVGQFGVGVAVYVTARIVWLFKVVLTRRK